VSGIVDIVNPENLRRQFLNPENNDKLFFKLCFEKNKTSLEDERYRCLRQIKFIYPGETEEQTYKDIQIKDVFEIFNNYTIHLPKEIEDDVITLMAEKIVEFKPRSREGDSYSKDDLGKIAYIGLPDEIKTHIFLAHEFPYAFCQNLITKANYMNALVTDISEFLNEKNIPDLYWFFISHDKDWLNINKSNDDSLLGNIHSKHLFQHNDNVDNIYENWIKRLNEMIGAIISGIEIKKLLPKTN
jgi:hypothetical protein